MVAFLASAIVARPDYIMLIDYDYNKKKKGIYPYDFGDSESQFGFWVTMFFRLAGQQAMLNKFIRFAEAIVVDLALDLFVGSALSTCPPFLAK